MIKTVLIVTVLFLLTGCAAMNDPDFWSQLDANIRHNQMIQELNRPIKVQIQPIQCFRQGRNLVCQ